MDQEKKKMKRRVLSSMLALCMILTSMPATPLWAAEEKTGSANETVTSENVPGLGSAQEIADTYQNTTAPDVTDEGSMSEISGGTPATPEEESDTPDNIEGPDVIESDRNEAAVLSDGVTEFNAGAADTPMSGNCGIGGGDNVKWRLEPEGGYYKLVISGKGEMDKYFDYRDNGYGHYVYAFTPWKKSVSAIKTIIIENGVSSVGAAAFWDCSRLTSITIPDSVSSIGAYAFYNCIHLASITIPNSVSSIGFDAFSRCSSLASITIPDSVSSIGSYAFSDCSSLTSITIPDSVSSIGGYTFSRCSSLTSITIPDSVSSIGAYAFSRCSSLTSITIPDNISRILEQTFSYCSSLASITIPDSVSSIGDYAFYDCSSLASITIPDSVTSIGGSAFSRCSSLANITIPDSVTSIGAYAFFGCSSLTSITIPDSVSSIGFYAFNGCSNLASITIPNSVSKIDAYAFDGCKNLEDIYYSGDKTSWIVIEGKNTGWDHTGNYIASNTTDDGYFQISYNIDGHACSRLAKIHYNSGEKDKKDYKVYIGDGYEIFDCSLEKCMKKTSSVEYNHQLAHMLIAMCNSVYNESNMKKTFSSFGFEAQNMKYNDITLQGDIMLGYGMAKKQVGSRTLVLLVARGTSSLEEWGSNLHMTVNDKKQHTGFADAANALYDILMGDGGFLKDIDLTKTNFVLTGFSRGAAASNILAARLADEGFDKKNIFAYNFACPDTVMDDNGITNKNKYNSIFNISNAIDIVSWAPGAVKGSIPGTIIGGIVGSVPGSGIPGAVIGGVVGGVTVGTATTYWRTWGRKYGKSYWYSDVWNDFEKLEMGKDAHDQALYLNALRKYDNTDFRLSDFKYRSTAKKALDDAVKKRNEKRIKKTRPLNISGRRIHRVVRGHCPVDIDIYSSDGSLVGSIVDNNIEIEDKDALCICINGDKKDIYLLNPDKYTFKIKGTDNGVLEYSVQDIDADSGQVIDEKFFPNVALTKGKEMTSQVSVWDDNNGDIKKEDKIDVQDVRLLVLDDKGKPKKEVLTDGKGTEVPIGSVIKVKKLKVTGTSKKISVGNKLKLKVSVSPANATNKTVIWRSSNTRYATVNSKGIVTIKKAAGGKTVTITATAKDGSKKKASYKIQCMKGVVKKVTISGKKTRSIKAGGSIRLKATVKATKGANKTLKWSSSNTKYATVNSKGKIITKKAGKGKTVKITATATDGSGKKTSVKVKIK